MSYECICSPSPKETHTEPSKEESQRMFADWQMMVEHNKKDYIETHRHVWRGGQFMARRQ